MPQFLMLRIGLDVDDPAGPEPNMVQGRNASKVLSSGSLRF
jgi:hypothetical protein